MSTVIFNEAMKSNKSSLYGKITGGMYVFGYENRGFTNHLEIIPTI